MADNNSEQVLNEAGKRELEERLTVFAGCPVCVTGSTGFVGSHLTRRLLGLGAKVTILVRNTSNKETVAEFAGLGARVVYGDVTDLASVREAVEGQIYVFHIAAMFREAKYADSVYYDVNLGGSRNVLDAAEEAGVKRVLHCSTIGVHSHIVNPPADESEPYAPTDVYQESKCEAEKLALERFRSGRVDGAVIRPAMIWGEGDRRLLKLYKGVRRRCFPVFGSGVMPTHWIYVHDLVNAFLLAAITPEASGQVYIIAGATPVSLNNLVEMVAERAGVKPLPFNIPVKPVQWVGSIVETICRPLGIEPPIHRRRADFFTKSRAFNTGKARRELGYKPGQTLKEEVDRIYTWYQDKGWLN